jgi:tRNA threonylcarbamoyladenosine biosynthesis protein TsaE
MKYFKSTITTNTEETQKLGESFSKYLKPGNIVALIGNLAAGKTSFVKGVLKGLDYKYEVTSPTFTLINEYYARSKVIHVDFYREENITRWNELGFQSMINSDSIILIEWADLIPDLLPDIDYKLYFEHNGEDKRKIKLK